LGPKSRFFEWQWTRCRAYQSLLVDAIAIFLGNDKDGTDVPFGHIIRVAMN
jgi:hypothetical protein